MNKQFFGSKQILNASWRLSLALSFCLLRYCHLWCHHWLVMSVTVISVTLLWVCWRTWLRQAPPLSFHSCPRYEKWVRRTLGCWDTSLRSMGQWVWLVRWAFTSQYVFYASNPASWTLNALGHTICPKINCFKTKQLWPFVC